MAVHLTAQTPLDWFNYNPGLTSTLNPFGIVIRRPCNEGGLGMVMFRRR